LVQYDGPGLPVVVRVLRRTAASKNLGATTGAGTAARLSSL